MGIVIAIILLVVLGIGIKAGSPIYKGIGLTVGLIVGMVLVIVGGGWLIINAGSWNPHFDTATTIIIYMLTFGPFVVALIFKEAEYQNKKRFNASEKPESVLDEKL